MDQKLGGSERPSKNNGSKSDGELPRAGSVKRARERMEAGLPPQKPRLILNYDDELSTPPVGRSLQLGPGSNDQIRVPQHPLQGIQEAQMASTVSSNQSTSPSLGAPVSNPSLTSQWPLGQEDPSTQKRNNSPTGDRNLRKGSPPQRPPRPNYVPPMLDVSRMQKHPPSSQYRQPQQQGQQFQSQARPQPPYWEDNYSLPTSQESFPSGASNTPGSLSRQSSTSSYGSIPEFPIHSMPLPFPLPRRSLGPPPSSRKGASSYYSQNSYVAPIPEELPETGQRSHGSYASSTTIPASWGDGPPRYYMDEGIGEEEEEDVQGGEGRESRSGDQDESTGLVRQASLGQRHKPSLKTIKSIDRKVETTTATDGTTMQAKNSESSPPAPITRTAVAAAIAGGVAAAASPSETSPSDSEKHTMRFGGTNAGTGYDSSSSTDDLVSKAPIALTTNIPSSALQKESQMSPASTDFKVNKILLGLEKGGALSSSRTPSPLTSAPSSVSEKGPRRPTPLNLGAVKEADARGSLTSLPDLIKRATRLASNLDRGRTASRLGMLDMLSAGDGTEKIRSPLGHSRSGSISDILASFPSPSIVTPSSERPPSRWPATFTGSTLALGQTVSPPGSPTPHSGKSRSRKCCGMPIWAFALVCIILLLLIAAAVVIPVTLIVLPREHSTPPENLSTCPTTYPCINGGTSVVVENSCRCVCANGFTGSSCTETNDGSCAITNIKASGQSSGTYTNVTLGNSIPRLLLAADSNYSIPLNATDLLSLFSTTNLSCVSENALVSFNGNSKRRDLLPIWLPEAKLIEESGSEFESHPIPSKIIQTSFPSITIFPRDATNTGIDTSTQDQTDLTPPTTTVSDFTSDSIVFAAPSNAHDSPTSIAVVTSSSTTSVAPAATSSSSSSSTLSSEDNPAVTQQILDFASIAVLYIFQETTLNTAADAQVNLQWFLAGSAYNGSTTNVGGGIKIDFKTLTVELANGTVVGGKAG